MSIQEKARFEGINLYLQGFVRGPEDDSQYERLLKNRGLYHKKDYINEQIVILKAFIVDFLANTTLKNENNFKEFLGGYYNTLSKSLSLEFYRNCKNYIDNYFDYFNKPFSDSYNPMTEVLYKFSENCIGYEDDDFYNLAANILESWSAFVNETLDKVVQYRV
jgi:hypothetical protein